MRRRSRLRSLLPALVAACGARTPVDLPGAPSASPSSTAPGTVLSNVVAISAGRSHTCALRSDGTVVCWGADDIGQLGDGTTNLLTNAPQVVPGLSDAVALAVGPDYTCVVRAAGTVACWGSSVQGYVADGATAIATPTEVGGLANATALTAGLGSACMLSGDASVWCWSGLAEAVHVTADPSLDGATAISGDGLGGECGLLPGGSVACDAPAGFGSPAGAPSISGATAISGGPDGGYAVLGGGQLVGWGEPLRGSPQGVTPVEGLGPVVAVSAGHGDSPYGTTCALLEDTTVACWGANGFGQLGDGTTADSSTPVQVAGLTDATAVATGWYHACAVLADHTAACWGNNQLRTADQGITDALTPVVVTF